MKVTIHFKDKQEPDMVLHGESLRIYESGAYTQVKSYGLGLAASIPTVNIQAIEYEREAEVTVIEK